ncbi:uncharacterized protein LOC134531252 [Bacillus rossius redtenbacheri]|uniref:uncharacterized protein LOC134531252 n=1 Tax=Bacillus rossius redtenbacheri TaxID=93214 RepID=UPI002FDECCB2
MEKECSVGHLTNEQCHKCVYGSVQQELKKICVFSLEQQQLIFTRVSSDVKSVYKYHEIKYLIKYHHIFGRYCSDPLQIHKKAITKGLREILPEHMYKKTNYNLLLVPGKSLCPTCYKKIFVTANDGTGDTCDSDFITEIEKLGKVDNVCTQLGVSPASKIRKLGLDKRPQAIADKISKVSNVLKRNLEESFDEVMENREASEESVEEFDELIKKLKDKCAVAGKEMKVKIISLLPNSWSRLRITQEFNVSDRLVKLTRDLVKDQGILPELGKKKGFGIQSEVVTTVREFYESDEYSRLCPGKKDCLSVKINNMKCQKQKRLVLCNLNELFVEFKSKHPDCRIGRSKFIELRPKWCVTAGSSGTHNVCVCTYHQNVKLMVDGAKLMKDYKDLLAILVCDMSSYECMMGKCVKCPGSEALVSLFDEFEESDAIPDNIIFQQWTTTDRAEMITVIQPKEEFFLSLIEKLDSLKTHNFISKIQSQHLREKKEKLNETECIVLADFAENFTFVIQDEIQSYHWVNRQATVHPFVYYYKENDKLLTQCVCVISDHLDHNTTTVHTFQSHLMKHLKDTVPSVQHIIYFSDGSSSQYKNKKNLINVCHHKNDFGLSAEWNFFATSHGKNACDGVGGTTKREVTKASLQRTVKDHILSPEDMYMYCTQTIKGMLKKRKLPLDKKS